MGIPDPEWEHEGLSEQTPLPHTLQGQAIWGLNLLGAEASAATTGTCCPPPQLRSPPYLRRVYDGHDHVEELAASQGLVWELQGFKSKAGLRRGPEGEASRALLSPEMQQGSSAPASTRASLLARGSAAPLSAGPPAAGPEPAPLPQHNEGSGLGGEKQPRKRRSSDRPCSASSRERASCCEAEQRQAAESQSPAPLRDAASADQGSARSEAASILAGRSQPEHNGYNSPFFRILAGCPRPSCVTQNCKQIKKSTGGAKGQGSWRRRAPAAQSGSGCSDGLLSGRPAGLVPVSAPTGAAAAA